MAQQLPPPPMEDTEFSWRWRNWLADNREKTIYRGAMMAKTSLQSIATGVSTTKTIEFEEVLYDTGGLADLSTNELVVPSDGTRIQLACNVIWQAAGTQLVEAMRCVQLQVQDVDGNTPTTSGTPTQQEARLASMPGFIPATALYTPTATQLGGFPFVQQFSTGIMDVQPGDRFRINANHDAAGSVNIAASYGTAFDRATWFSMVVYG